MKQTLLLYDTKKLCNCRPCVYIPIVLAYLCPRRQVAKVGPIHIREDTKQSALNTKKLHLSQFVNKNIKCKNATSENR